MLNSADLARSVMGRVPLAPNGAHGRALASPATLWHHLGGGAFPSVRLLRCRRDGVFAREASTGQRRLPSQPWRCGPCSRAALRRSNARQAQAADPAQQQAPQETPGAHGQQTGAGCATSCDSPLREQARHTAGPVMPFQRPRQRGHRRRGPRSTGPDSPPVSPSATKSRRPSRRRKIGLGHKEHEGEQQSRHEAHDQTRPRGKKSRAREDVPSTRCETLAPQTAARSHRSRFVARSL